MFYEHPKGLSVLFYNNLAFYKGQGCGAGRFFQAVIEPQAVTVEVPRFARLNDPVST